MKLIDNTANYTTNYQRLIYNSNKDKKKTEQKKVKIFFKALKEILLEKEGGVYLDFFGYFCILQSPKRVYNRNKEMLEYPRIPHLFTELSRVRRIKRWSMSDAFKSDITDSVYNGVNYKEYFKLIKENYVKPEIDY